MTMGRWREFLLKYDCKIISSIVILEVAVTLWLGIVTYYGSVSGLYKYIVYKFDSVPRIGLVEKGISKNEMLLRFGSADYLLMHYDKKYGSEITEYCYRIDEDSDLFLKFVYSFQTRTVVDFDMVRRYRGWIYKSYGS